MVKEDIINRLSLEIIEINLKLEKDVAKIPFVHLKAILTIDGKQFKLKYLDKIIVFSNTHGEDSSFLAKNTQKYIKNLLKAYIVGLTAKSSITVGLPFDECDSNECKLEK